MKYLFIFFIANSLMAKEIEGEKYKWYVVTEKVVNGKTVTEEQEANEAFIKLDEDTVCEVEKEYIRGKFEIYPNLRTKKMTCNNLGEVFVLNTACLKSEKLQIIINFKENKLNKNNYHIRCEL